MESIQHQERNGIALGDSYSYYLLSLWGGLKQNGFCLDSHICGLAGKEVPRLVHAILRDII